jgi:hypothetical protein
LYKALPVLTLEQISRVLQKPIANVYEMSRARAQRPLPVFKSGKTLCSTWAKIQQWIDEGFAEKAPCVSKNMARLGRLELPTCCSGGNRSIHLSYRRTV